MEQPKYCTYPDATRPMWGCWSLLAGWVKDEEYCKDCECYDKRKVN